MPCILHPLQPQRVSPIVSIFLYMNTVDVLSIYVKELKKNYTLRISKCLSAFEIVFWQELEGKSTYDMI